MKQINKIVLCSVILFIILGLHGYSQEEEIPLWAQDLDISEMDIEQIRIDYSLWNLLSECETLIEGKSKKDAEIAAYYINPLTYIHLRGSRDDELIPPETLRDEMEEVYNTYFVFYIILKSEENEEIIKSEDWKFTLVAEGKREVEPENIEASEPEYVFGYSGDYYEKTALLFFNKTHRNTEVNVDVMKGDYLIASNKAYKIRGELSWTNRPAAERKVNPALRSAIKIILTIVFLLFVVICIITKPPQEWFKKRV
jgi:hypothetical protein